MNRLRDLPARLRYALPREQPLAIYLLVSAAVFTGIVLLGHFLPEEKGPAMIEVELGIDAVENEPPPLGTPEAGAGEKTPEPPLLQPETPPPPVETPPEPEPVPAPPPVVPQFIVPEEKAPATPRPKPAVALKEKPRHPAPHTAPAASVAPGSDESKAEAGLRGSPGGVAGGHGGGRGDFIATPTPQYDETARIRGYQGHGMFLIRYQDGRITGVNVAQSTGVPYLDARTTAWIQAHWRVKEGVSGMASLPVTWQLH